MESGLAALPVAVTQQNNTITNAQKNKGGFGGGLLYILRNIGAGVVGVGEGIYDYIVGGFAKAAGNESYARHLMENNISGRMQQRAYDDFNPNKGWEFAGQVASGIGQSTVGLVVAAGLTAATGGGALVAGLASGATIGLSAAGLSTADAYNKTGELGGKEFLYGAASGLVEGGLEGVTGAAGKIGARVAKQTARSTAKNVVRKSLVKDVFTDACGEFVEESLSEIIQPYLERGLKIDENAENATAQEVVYAGLVGFVSGALMSGTTSAAMSARNAARGDNAIKTGKVNEIINEATAISKYVTEAENSKLVLPAFRDMTASLNAYNNTADKTSLLAKTYLGEVQRGIANVRASAFVQNSRDNIMNNADAIVDWYAKQGQTISADDIRADKDGIATRIAISDVAGKLIMPDYTSRTMGTAINKAEKEFRKKGIISDETNNEIVDAYRQMERLNVERNGGTIDEADYTYSQDYQITADDLKKFKDGADFMQKRDMLADNYENSYDRDNQNMAIFSAISSGKTTVAEVEAIKKLAKRGGVKVRWENVPIKDGNVVNGSYESGTITINVRGVDSFSRTVVHEYIHNIAKNAQTVFAKLRTAIESVCAENTELQKVYDNAIEAYKKAEPGKSDAYYAEDAVCKVAERFISEFGTNEKGKIDLSNVDKGHIRTIREFFNRIRERVKQFGVKKSNDNMTNVTKILDEILSKKTVDKSKNVANNMENNRKSYAGQHSQTWDESRRDRAIDMMLDKKSPEEIYRETGLFIGADGYMRYEIDDSKMKVNRHIPVSDSSTLSSIDKTNKLNEHYKERVIYYERTIEDFQTRLDGYNLPDLVAADYKKSIRRYKKEIADIKKEIRINDNRLKLLLNEAQVNIDIDKAGVNALYNKDTTTKAKLSEIITHDELFKAYPQIRNVEIVFNKNMKKGEFANATIPQKGGVRSSAYIEVSKQAFYKDGVFSVGEFKKTLMHEVQHIIQAYEGFANGSLPSEQYERLRRIAVADYKKNPSAYKNIADTAEEFADVMVTPRDAFRAYQNVYGEQEARNVEDRLKLSKEERAKTMPFAGNKDSILSTGERPINGVASQKSYTDEFATLAMQWAHSDKTKVGDWTVRFKGDVPILIEKTEEGFRKVTTIKQNADYNKILESINEHNDRARDSGLYDNLEVAEFGRRNDSGNSGNDGQRYGQNARDGRVYQEKSERNGNGTAERSREDRRYSISDEFATLAMQWAHSDKTKVGERTIRFKGDVPIVIEKTEDGFRKIRIKEKAESSLWRKVNEHNDRQRESGVLTDAGRLRTLPGDLLGNSGNDEQRHKQGERDGGLYRGKSQRDGNGTDKQSDGDRRYSISDQLEQAHPLLEMPTHERSKRIVDIKERAKDTKTSFLIGWVNAQAGIEKYCKLLGEKNIEATTNFARASSSAANYMIEKELRPLFESLKKGRSYDKEYATVFMEYLLHWHNTDRMAQGIEKPVFGESVSAEGSRARISNIEKVHPEFKALAVQVWKYGKKLLTMQKDGGLITQELYDTLSARYPHYVPTFRDGEGAQTIGAIRGKGFIEINRSIKSAKGSDLNILPIDVMLARKTMQIFKASRINAVAQSLCRAGIADENMSRVAVIGRERVNADVDYDLYRPKNNQITFFENGEAVTLAVSSDIFKGFDAFHSNPNSEWNNPILNATTKWNNAFKKLVTAYNPFFTVRNALRDLQDAGLYTRHSWAQFAKNYAVAYKEITTNGKYWQEYRAAGGLNSSVFDYERGYKRSPSGLKKALSIIETVNIAVEQAPRLSEFISSRQAGVGVEQSLLNAADVTVNFGRSGVFARKLNSTAVPFLNPSIQGFDKFIRTAFGRKTAKEWVRLIIRAAMLGIGAGLLNDLLLGDDDEYKNLRQTDKENYYILKIGQGKFLKLPKGRINASIGQIFYTSKQLANKEKVDWKSELSNLNANMSPVENLGRFVWSPFTDAASNRTWYGTPIESAKFENVAPKNRYDENTSSIAIAIGKAINYSPKKINYLLDQYTGIIGDIVLPVTTKASSRNIIEQNFTLDSVSQSKTSTAFYDEIEEATYAKNDGDLLAKAKLSYLNKMKKKVSDINRQKRDIQNSELSNSEKKEQVRALQVLINGIQNTALQNVGIFEDELSRYNLTEETYDAVYLASYRSAFGAQSAFEQYDTNVYAKAKLMNTLGIDYENYFDIYFTLKTTENDVDKKGNVVKGSKKNKATKYIKSLKGLSAVQKAIILATAGYSLNDSLKSKVKSLAKGLSEEDKAMLYNICGITDKKKSITAVA
nr:MAG TPA: Type I restriction enzyme Methylase [Caudoviricetes sp.]